MVTQCLTILLPAALLLAHAPAAAGVSVKPTTDTQVALTQPTVPEPAAAQQAGDGGFRDRLPDGSTCDFCPEMVVVPSGSFRMGTAAADWSRHEGPRHEVRLGYRLAIGRFEVTYDQWDACVEDGGCNGYRPPDDGRGRGRLPVAHVSHDDALGFIDWLNRRLDLRHHEDRYRLPSEAEWEYAARAGSHGAYWWGGAPPACSPTARSGARFADDGSCAATGPSEVGGYAANGFGLHDVAGNVREWVADCWHDSYDDAPADGSPWMTGGDCIRRVVRGGSWRDGADALRAAWRTGLAAGLRRDANGFRLARDLALRP